MRRLFRKTMYDQIDPVAHVYAPAGSDVQDYLNTINGFNTRSDSPTSWIEKVYTGDDFSRKDAERKKGQRSSYLRQ